MANATFPVKKSALVSTWIRSRAQTTARSGILAAIFAISPAISKPDLGVIIKPSGEMQTLYSWSKQRCADEFIPDAPARAFRRADDDIVLIATHRENWSLVGKNFKSLHPVCRSILSSSQHKRERLGEMWIEGTYTTDGKDVIALISQDMRFEMQADGCDPTGEPGRCWINNIIAARSHDMGQTFEVLPAKNRTVATIGATYAASMKGRFGVFTTSNIVRFNNDYYMIAWAQGSNVQQIGNCIFRSADPFDPAGWKAWNGKEFAVQMQSETKPSPCAILDQKALPTEVRSLSYITSKKTWVAVFAARLQLLGDDRIIPGFYYSESSDLTDWNAPKRIMAAPLKAREEQSEFMVAYPSLIDPHSLSRNFETIDSERPMLFFMKHHLANGNGTMNRDLVAVPLSIQ
jgi:hypothetical protein